VRPVLIGICHDIGRKKNGTESFEQFGKSANNMPALLVAKTQQFKRAVSAVPVTHGPPPAEHRYGNQVSPVKEPKTIFAREGYLKVMLFLEGQRYVFINA